MTLDLLSIVMALILSWFFFFTLGAFCTWVAIYSDTDRDDSEGTSDGTD